MKILAIDTSTDVCSVCVTVDNEVVAEYATRCSRTHTERLMPAVDQLFSHIGWPVAQLDALAVIHGPGSFTGLRIGISTVKGLAFALDRPVVAASALEVAALQVPGAGWVCPAMDARRGEIFTALYRKEGELVQEVMAPRSVTPERWRDLLPEEPIAFCGPGAALYYDLIRKPTGSHLHFRHFFLGKTLAHHAYSRMSAGHVIGAAQLRAAYLRPSDAETKGPRPNRKSARISG